MLWTGTQMGGQIWRSSDGGDSWSRVGTGINSGLFPDFTLGRNPSNGPRLFVNYEQSTTQIYYSDDLGSTFTPSPVSGTTYQPALAIADSDPSVVYCGTDLGVYKSTDYGATWAPTPLGSLVWSLLAGQTEDVYAGRNRTGVSVSHDDGASWSALNTGIEDQVMWDLCYGEIPIDLFCSPRGRGVKKITLPWVDAVDDAQPGLRMPAFPNPFRESVTVRFGRTLADGARIRVMRMN